MEFDWSDFVFIVNCGYLDASRFSDRCFQTFRCKTLSDVLSCIDSNISRKRYCSVRIADPSDEHISSWPIWESDNLFGDVI